MHFLDFVLRNLLRRRVRTTLTVFGVSVAIAAVVALLSITGGYERTSKDVLAGHGVDLVVLRAGVANRETSTLDESLAKRLEKLPGVARVAMSLRERVSFQKGSLIGRFVNGWPADSFAFDTLTVLPPGRKIEPGDKDVVMVGKVLAQTLKKGLGEEVDIEGKMFKVIGIYESGNMVENQSAIVPLRDLQELMERLEPVPQVNQFEIALRSDIPNRDEFVANLRKQIEDLRKEDGEKLGLAALPTEEFVRSDNQIRLAHAMAWVTGAIALIVGCIGMLNTMIVSVLERTQEIGILRAIGWRKARIVRMIMIESFTLSFTGAIFGILLAYVMIRVLASFPAARGFVSGDITLQVVIMAYLLSVLVGLVGGAYPALRGASLPPTEALRYE